LAAKVLAVVLAEAVALLLSTALCLLALLAAYGVRDQYPPAVPWQTLLWVEGGGVLAAWVAASAVTLGAVVTRSPLGGLLLGLFAYIADLALSFQSVDLYAADLGAAGAPFARYLVTWNTVSLAVHEFQPLPEPGWHAARMVLYSAVLLALAGWLFWRQDLTRRTWR
jgi:ABC-type transport system involved in multi-copper enzyme maturation permease subunit